MLNNYLIILCNVEQLMFDLSFPSPTYPCLTEKQKLIQAEQRERIVGSKNAVGHSAHPNEQ